MNEELYLMVWRLIGFVGFLLVFGLWYHEWKKNSSTGNRGFYSDIGKSLLKGFILVVALVVLSNQIPKTILTQSEVVNQWKLLQAELGYYLILQTGDPALMDSTCQRLQQYVPKKSRAIRTYASSDDKMYVQLMMLFANKLDELTRDRGEWSFQVSDAPSSMHTNLYLEITHRCLYKTTVWRLTEGITTAHTLVLSRQDSSGEWKEVARTKNDLVEWDEVQYIDYEKAQLEIISIYHTLLKEMNIREGRACFNCLMRNHFNNPHYLKCPSDLQRSQGK